MIIVNADDFGISREVNEAVITCFHEGVISSATIMPNMAGFEQACNLAHQNKLSSRIGIHLNLTEGQPISSKILGEPRLCNESGNFCFQRNAMLFFTNSEKAALNEEIDSQIKRCFEMGLSPVHIDSHHHVHTEWAVFGVIRPLLGKHRLKFVRVARNDNNQTPVLRRFYKGFFNAQLSHMKVRRTVYFGDAAGFAAMRDEVKRGLKSFEIMVHPTLGKNGMVVDKKDGIEIRSTIRTLTQGLEILR